MVNRCTASAKDNVVTDLLVVLDALHRARPSPTALLRKQRDAATGQDAFFDGRTGCVQRILDASLLFLHFRLGRRTDVDLGNAAGEFRQTLFELFLVVIRLVLFSISRRI